LCVCLTVTSLLFKPDARIMIVYVFAFQRLCMSVTCCCSLCFVCRLSVPAGAEPVEVVEFVALYLHRQSAKVVWGQQHVTI